MGNAAVIQNADTEDLYRRYLELEERCKSGYYHQNKGEYIQVLRHAISHNLLDHLEILLISGDISKAYPVHLAAKFGKIEALELLLSAGFPGNSKDREEKTPLHYACSIVSSDTALCVSLLLIHYPTLVRSYDREGNTPVHVAVIAENIAALQIMKDQNVPFNSILDTSGNKPLDVAKRNKLYSVVDFFKGRLPLLVESKGIIDSEAEKVSQERIMAVWEKFFENAFLQAGVAMDDEEISGDNYRYSNQKAPTRNKSNSTKKSTTKSKAKGNDYASYRASFLALEAEEDDGYSSAMYKADPKPSTRTNRSSASSKVSQSTDSNYAKYISMSSSSAKAEEIPTPSAVVDVPSWLSKIATIYDSSDGYSEPSYILIDRYSLIQQWLPTYMDELYYYGWQYWFLYSDAETIQTWNLPETLEDVVQYGWMNFYDRRSNSSVWFNVISGCQEPYLPLLQGVSIDWLEYYGLHPSYYEDGSMSVWVEADQSIAKAWVLVIMEEYGTKQESAISEYYLNQITGDTMWDKPSTWDLLVHEWNGWLLCCMESNPQQKFWYDPVTDESQWLNT